MSRTSLMTAMLLAPVVLAAGSSANAQTIPPIHDIALDLADGLEAEAGRLEQVARLRRDFRLTALAASLRSGANRLRPAAASCASARCVAAALDALDAVDMSVRAIQADLGNLPR